MKKLIALAVVLAGALGAYHALVFYDNNFRYGRMRETPAVKPHEEPLIRMEGGIVPVFGGDAVLRATPGPALKPSFAMEDANVIARGKAVYFTFCAQCHGLNFDGNGTVGQSFMPLPTDFRSPAVQSKSAGELFKSVSYGIPGGRQPPLETTIPIDDRWCVVAFVKSMGVHH
ncbi:MAG: c-type cytochrome [Desulfobacterales bacterium]|jgi:mono/diheme cytochrome c family protein|nr:c-type cytochrome [Desulfobacterales bacterium]